VADRNPDAYLRRIHDAAGKAGRTLRVMEVCGTHTHAIGRGGLRGLLGDSVELVSGPGCPVCVTSQRDIERILQLARNHALTLATFGDMIRVPGIESSLEHERSEGADVRVVYSPLDAIALARRKPDRQVVFIAAGFETTAPGVAAVMRRAREEQAGNLSFFPAHKRVVPAMQAVLEGGSAIDGFLTPGHVSVIIGAEAYEPLATRYGIPCVAAGFEPADILEGLAMLAEAIAEARHESSVQYHRAIRPGGNPRAREIMLSVFENGDAEWRGIGMIPDSGLVLKEAYHDMNALQRFNIPDPGEVTLPGCRCGEVLKGLIHPPECPLFGKTCTPRNPVGPCMVSSEGSCAARYRYG
jgi:hydrogenase expression/formation protein HypD